MKETKTAAFWSCELNPGNCGIENYAAWNSSQLYDNFVPKLLTPWPDTRVERRLDTVARGAGHTMAVSDSLVYKADQYLNCVLTLNACKNPSALTYSHLSPYWVYVEEPYPQGGVSDLGWSLNQTRADASMRDEGKSRYLRSDLNFLYFNEAAASVYKPWPSLGGSGFPKYNDDNARYPVYNPIGTSVITADLDNSLGAANISYLFADYVAVNYRGYIGQYWKRNASDALIWNKGSYTGACWSAQPGINCNEVMSSAKKVEFAHWFTYWRSSFLATRGMMGLLFDRLGPGQADLLDRFRFAFSVNKGGGVDTAYTGIPQSWGGPAASGRREITDLYSVATSAGVTKAARQDKFLEVIRNLIYTSDTDFRAAWNPLNTNNYFKNQSVYRDDPASSASPVRSCRRSYEVVLTPDYTWLRRGPSASYPSIRRSITTTNTDDADLSLGAPYSDRQPNTLADAGALGWKTDLLNNPSNHTLLPSKLDEATWPHLVRFVIAPAATGIVFPNVSGAYTRDQALTSLRNADWTYAASQYRDPNYNHIAEAYDDLWHMALNSRGMFYPSTDVSKAVENILAVMSDILARNVSGSSVATNTATLTYGGTIYQATVEGDWKGHLRAYPVRVEQRSGNDVLAVKYNDADMLWDLATNLTASHWSSGRNIVTYNGRTGVPFRWADTLGSTAKGYLKAAIPTGVTNEDAYAAKLLEYLRGSVECEDVAGSSCVSGVPYVFRRRNLDRSITTTYSLNNPTGRNVLGDISNSSPWVVSPPVAGPSDVDFPGYNAFRVANKARANALYVGANDGYLHAVNANNGNSLFSYLPSFVLRDLHHYASPSYIHRFYADGSPFSADVNLTGRTDGWRTVLASGTNKGGMGYFLLDVTTPSENVESNASDWVKWEFTSANDSDINYSFNLPVADEKGQARQIARMSDGKWALIVGNGYPTADDKQACLFVIYLAGPTAANGSWIRGRDYHKICAGTTRYSDANGINTNGLSTPRPYDSDGDGLIDTVYAGDLNGNMWRFDVSSKTSSDANGNTIWSVANSGSPVFVAKNSSGTRQPIISPPEVASYAVGDTRAQLLLFGTGKYIEPQDRANVDTQTFYAVWDRGLPGVTRSSLFQQTFESATANSRAIRRQTTKPVFTYCATGADVSACSTGGKYLGWYWDMSETGERLTGKVSLINNIVLFNTFYPSVESYTEGGVTKTRLDPCQYGGDGWIMGLNAEYGYMEDQTPIFDLNQDGVVNSSDTKAAGVKVGAAIGGTSFARGIGATHIGISSPTNLGSNQSEKMTTIINTGSSSGGRVSWFELTD